MILKLKLLIIPLILLCNLQQSYSAVLFTTRLAAKEKKLSLIPVLIALSIIMVGVLSLILNSKPKKTQAEPRQLIGPTHSHNGVPCNKVHPPHT